MNTASILTAIDPDQSGYVNIDDVVTHWQNIGVETPHEQSLETVLTEVSSAVLKHASIVCL